MYHISPKTGTPQICTAQPGACPYRHFNTYEEARLESDKLLSDFFSKQEFGPLEIPDDIYHSIIMRYGKDEIIELLKTTEDKILLSDVFHQKTSLGKNSDYFKAIVHNPNLPDSADNVLFRGPYKFSKEIFLEYSRGPLVTRNWDTMKENWTLTSPREEIPDYVKHLSNYQHFNNMSQEDSEVVSRLFRYFPFTENDIKLMTAGENAVNVNFPSQKLFQKPPFSSIFLNLACSQSIRDDFESRNNIKIEYEEKFLEPIEFVGHKRKQPY